MHDIHSEKQRNAQAGFFDRYPLYLTYLFITLDIEQPSDLSPPYPVGIGAASGLACRYLPGCRKIELSYLLFDSHPVHQS